MPRRLVISIRVKGTDLPAVTVSLKGMLKSYFAKNPGFSHVRLDAESKKGRISVEGVGDADLMEYLRKACAELGTARGWQIRTEVAEAPEEAVNAAEESAPAIPRAPDVLQSAPQIESKRMWRYRILLTADVMQRLALVQQERREPLEQALLALASGDWERWGDGEMQGFSSWREEGDHGFLFTLHIPGVGVLVWERVTSVDLLGRIAYPVGAYYDTPPPSSYFMPHVVLHALESGLPQPSFTFNFMGHLYKEEPGLVREVLSEPPTEVDELAYTEELYLLSPNRIGDVLIGQQTGLPLHLSEEQVAVIGVPGPILLSGEAGSGKTSVITQWLVINHLRHQGISPPPEPMSQLFVTFSERLRDRTGFEFSTMLPPVARDHRTEFRTYRELLWGVLELGGVRGRYPQSTEMTFERFMKEYAPKQSHTDVDPVLLWDEIRSVIKGGVTAESESFMDFAKYEQLSEERGQCKTPQHLREEYYESAQGYQNYLTKNRLWDGVDLARACVIAADIAPKYAKIACDEVQDLAPVEIVLLFRLLERKDVSDLFFTGDTAQVINPSGFLWSRLKKELSEKSGKRVIPEVHFLTRNYRSCYEIVDLVNRVLLVRRELINDEVSRIEQTPLLPAHVRPMVLRSSPVDLLKSLQSNPNTRLVLTKTARERAKLEAVLGDSVDKVTILTIEEAKGLEFEGALLWNFFLPRHEAITKNDWESVFVPEKRVRLKAEIERGDRNPYGLTYEFNLLHVGLTRARRLLFVFDEDPKMRIANLGDEVASALASAEFEDFQVHWATEAPSAEDLNEAATRLLARDTEQAHRLFALAAKAFESGGELERAAECHEVAGRYDQAARCYKASGDRPNELKMLSRRHESSGEYAEAGKLQRERGNALLKTGASSEASEAFEEARRLYDAASEHETAANCAWLSADALPSGRVVDRAVKFQSAAERAAIAGDRELAIRAYDRSLREAELAKQAGTRILPGEPIEHWIACGHLEIARLYEELQRYGEAAKAARRAAGLWRTLADIPDSVLRRSQYEESFRDALALTTRALIEAGEPTQAAARQKELLSSLREAGGIEEVQEVLNGFAELYFNAGEYDLYVDTKLDLSDWLMSRREHQLALRLLQDAIGDCKEAGLTPLVLSLAEKRVSAAEDGKDWEEAANSHRVAAQAQEELGDLRKALETLRKAGIAHLKIDDQENAEACFLDASRLASKAMSAVEAGWFCFKEVAVDAYARRNGAQLATIWVSRAGVHFAQDLDEAVLRLEKFRMEQVQQIQRIDSQRSATESSSRKVELGQRRDSELRIQAWSELALAVAYSDAAPVSGDQTLWHKADGWWDQARASFDAAGDRDALREVERLAADFRRSRASA